MSIRCSGATARCWRWTSPATARATPKSLLVVSSACHGVEGFCGSGVQVALLRRRGTGTQAGTAPASPCSTSTRLNPYGFSWWRRTTHENVDLNRNFRDFTPSRCRATPRYDELAALLVPDDLAAGRGDGRRASSRFVAEHGDAARCSRPSRAASTTIPTACSTAAAADLEPARRCARCCATTARAASGSAWIDLHTGLGPSGHGERIFACRDDAAALRARQAWWGDVTSIYDGSSTSALLTGLMWLAAYEECAAGRVHRHRARVRHRCRSPR